MHATFSRDHEYKRHGTVSLLAGIDLLTGQVHALVKDRHRSREFIDFLKLIDAAYPADTAIRLIFDNHSTHISKETKAWLAQQPVGRFEFTFPPTHGSWLNLIEGFFSKLARCCACACRKSYPAILMVQFTQNRAADDIPGPLNAARDRGILVQ